VRDRRVWLMALGIPGLLLYATLGVAQWRSSLAMNEFTRLQKAYPPDSLKKVPAEIPLQKLQALTLAERLAPDNPEIAYQTSLFHLVRAETESLQPPSDSAGSENENDSRLAASLKEGLAWINRAITLNPGYAEYPFVKASILQNLSGLPGEEVEQGAVPKAVASLLHEADRLDPYRPSLHFRIGSFWIALDERDQARDAFAITLSDSIHYARPVFSLLWSSVDDVGDLQNFVGDSPLSRALLGDFLWIHGYPKEAQVQFDKVEAAGSLDYLTGEALIGHYIREHEGERARKVIDRMQKSGPRLSLFYQARLEYFRGKSLYQEQRYQEAIGCFERSLSLDPSVIQSHLDLASAYLEEGQPQKAIARWRFILARGIPVPQEVAGPGEIHFGLGRAYEALGDRSRALSEYLRASSEDPGNVNFSRKASEITQGL
jgi:tetratricopeptide (TPR) repeat protein